MPESVRFRPSRVEGAADVTEVTEVVVSSTHLEVEVDGEWQRHALRDLARARNGAIRRLLHRIAPRRWPLLVGERDWCHPPAERFFRWYTTPPLKTCMPVDEAAEPLASSFLKIREVLREGGFVTYDLG